MVAYILALFTLNVSNYNAWMEDAPPQFLSFFFFLVNFDGFSLNKRYYIDSQQKKQKKKASYSNGYFFHYC